MLTINAPITITDDVFRGLLCTAFEGGSAWVRIEEYDLADGLDFADFREGGRFQDPKEYWHPSQIVPLHEGCALVLRDKYDDKPKNYRLDRASLERGIRLLAERYPRYLSDVLAEDYDVIPADAFLQLAVFGEVVYG